VADETRHEVERRRLNAARLQLRLTRVVVENRRETVQLVVRRVAAGYTAPLDEAR
jgi:multidrug efflux system outer membrane protein